PNGDALHRTRPGAQLAGGAVENFRPGPAEQDRQAALAPHRHSPLLRVVLRDGGTEKVDNGNPHPAADGRRRVEELSGHIQSGHPFRRPAGPFRKLAAENLRRLTSSSAYQRRERKDVTAGAEPT